MRIGSCSDDTICGVIALHQLDNHELATLFNPISSSYYPYANSSAWIVLGLLGVKGLPKTCSDCVERSWNVCGVILQSNRNRWTDVPGRPPSSIYSGTLVE